jgi:hypothetical protein
MQYFFMCPSSDGERISPGSELSVTSLPDGPSIMGQGELARIPWAVI